MNPERSSSPAPLRWVKPPQQARSQKTLERLLDAAEDVIRERGVANLTVSEVARRAGSSVGAFYARFEDKEGLLATLHERTCTEALATAEVALDPARWGSADIAGIVEEVVRFTAAQCEARLGLMLAFVALAASDVSYARRRAALEEKISARLGALLVEHVDEIAHADPMLAASVTVRMVLGTLESDALARRISSTEPARTDAVLAGELSRAVVAFIGAPVSGGRRSRTPR
ncbi:MAG TPA: TetR/AcrR family transcriptional regulator [Polyangiaceae bacterium]|jgi:AcrR family transcriptional regulator|nr:TetR/AcrR family transcriptional regulator [Polyangiaceae bacterium]